MFASIFSILLLVDIVIGQHLYRVERNHVPRRSPRPFARRVNSGFHREALMDNVIHSPIENKRIFTKNNFYINAINPKEKEAIVYENMLLDGKGSINDIDAFFVTPPPTRTTLAPKRLGDLDLPELVKVSDGSVKEDEVTKKPGRANDLRLVTLAPLIPSTVAPFKHNVVRQVPSRSLRFPAQAWQIPPSRQVPTTTITPLPFLPSTLQPLNPFQLWTLPPPPVPSQTLGQMPIDQFIPIPIATPPPPLPPTLLPPQQQTFNSQPPSQHRQSIHQRGFARTFGQQPIPLPSPSQIDTPLNRELEQSIVNPLAKKPQPQIDYSIDNTPTITKDVQPPSTQLKSFVKEHPHVMNNIQKPLVYRGKEMVIPKMFNVTNNPYVPLPQQPSPIQAISHSQPYVPLMNPNQKLDSCCRKQGVSPFCQNLCNFDTFNDKTLVSAFITAQCPGPQLGQAYDCASSKADHSQCCERAGLATFQGGKCMPFCQTHLSTPSNVLDYFVCLQVFESIKGCYRDYQFYNPNIFGD